MTEAHSFQPDWVSAPGETIADILEEHSLSPTEFASRLGSTVAYTEELIQGKAVVTPEIARKLSLVLGTSEEFWRARESHFRFEVSRLQRGSPSREGEAWLDELPLKDMLAFGWIKVAPGVEYLEACLRYFAVRNVSAWRDKYKAALAIAAFRTSPSFLAQPGAVAAWLRQGEIQSNATRCNPWDARRFRESLAEIRGLTRQKDPNIFIPALTDACSASGVSVAILRAPVGCRASGATWFQSESKAILLLSFRYLSDDHFWFTFFHEAGHLLLHSKTALFLEDGETDSNDEEAIASDFAANILIPPEFKSEMLALPVDGRAVMRFARRIGVSPGIVVGQLQHCKRLTRRQLNNLKIQYSWEE